MNYLSTTEYKLKAIPGVTIKLRKMSHGRRMKLNQDAADIFSKIGDVQRELEPIEESIKDAEAVAKTAPCSCPEADPPHEHDEATHRCKTAGCECRMPQPDPTLGGYPRRAELTSKMFDILVYELYPVYMRWGIASVQGLDIDGVPATADSMVEAMPENVIYEIGGEIQRLIRLSPEEVLSFGSPSTSGAAVDGQAQPTALSTAPPASGTSGISSATADATTQS